MKRVVSRSTALYVASAIALTAGWAQSTIDPTSLLRIAKGAFVGGGAATSVTLTGQASWIAGSTNESGQVTLIARADGSSSAQLSLESGSRTDLQDTFANGQVCTWSDSSGTVHATSAHNCMIPVAWFLPEVAIFSPQQPSTGTFTASVASVENQPLLHWSLTPPTTADPDQAALFSRVGSYDLELGLATALPSALSYTVHPDDNVGIDIPVTILYSDYRTVDGVAVPFRIQRYFNGTLSLDITLNNAVVAH